jgi:hypothetical protein
MDTGLLIYTIAKLNGFSDLLASFATSQAAHETAVSGIPFSSPVFRTDNNAFGMTYAGQSMAVKSTKYFIDTTGKKTYYAHYLSVDDSVLDFTQWWFRHRWNPLSMPIYINSLEGYVRFLKNQKYFEAPEEQYLKGCQYFYKLLFQ